MSAGDGVLWVEGLEVHRLVFQPYPASCFAFLPDGQRLLCGAYGNQKPLQSRVIATGEIIQEFSGHENAVLAIALSADGRHALSGSADSTVRLWDVDNGRELFTFEGHTGSVNSVAFSSDGKCAVSGGADGTVRLWRLQAFIQSQ
jgi:WD40 repeat protein